MAQTKADRSAAAKKAAATRERNQKKARSQSAGTKAAATRQGKAAGQAAGQARRAAGGVVSATKKAVGAAGVRAECRNSNITVLAPMRPCGGAGRRIPLRRAR